MNTTRRTFASALDFAPRRPLARWLAAPRLAGLMLTGPMLTGLMMASATPSVFAQAAGVPLMKPALPASAAAAQGATPRTINWENLVPAGWDPFKDFKNVDMGSLVDGDPKADALLKKMRSAWDNAPVNPELVGKSVRIPGFVVPLEEGKDGLKEFLLVPYFGACVHSPPPPSNQIIHVLPKSAAKGYRSMDTVWVSGVLKSVQSDTYMGAASWRLEALSVAPYSEAGR